MAGGRVAAVVMSGEEGTAGPSSGHRSKVGRVIERYGLDGLGDELERRWVGEGRERESLRDLANAFNRRVLRAAIDEAGEPAIEGEVENHYRLLTADDVSAAARTQSETRLERLGVNVDALRGDFVSHQAVHTYLTEVRGASLDEEGPSPDDAIERRSDTIQGLRYRLVAVTERSLETLRAAGHLTLGEFNVTVGISVYCADCETTSDVADLLRRRGCDCAEVEN